MDHFTPEQLAGKPTAGRRGLMDMFRNYFFIQRYCLACAQWASGCRELNRQAAIRELRIEEARDYLDLLQDACKQLIKASEALVHQRKTNSSLNLLQEAISLVEMTERYDFRLQALDDRVLQDLHERLRLSLREEHSHIRDLTRRVGKPSGGGIETVAGGLQVSSRSAAGLIHRMQERLDELARIGRMKCPQREITL